MNKIDNSQRVAAKGRRESSLLFSPMAIVMLPNYVLLNPLIVRGNAVETARNVMAHETQFRVALTCSLLTAQSLWFSSQRCTKFLNR